MSITLRLLTAFALVCLAARAMAQDTIVVSGSAVLTTRGAASHEDRQVTFLGVVAELAGPVVRYQLGLPEGVGLVVGAVMPDSPAAKAGLRQYDILHKLDDQLLLNPDQLRTLVQMHKAGEEVKLTLFRKAKSEVVPVTMTQRKVESGEFNIRLAPGMPGGMGMTGMGGRMIMPREGGPGPMPGCPGMRGGPGQNPMPGGPAMPGGPGQGQMPGGPGMRMMLGGMGGQGCMGCPCRPQMGMPGAPMPGQMQGPAMPEGFGGGAMSPEQMRGIAKQMQEHMGRVQPPPSLPPGEVRPPAKAPPEERKAIPPPPERPRAGSVPMIPPGQTETSMISINSGKYQITVTARDGKRSATVVGADGKEICKDLPAEKLTALCV